MELKFTHSEPFGHSIHDDFLTSTQMERICEIYNSLQFHENCTDLYRFYQSDELVGLTELEFFLTSLNGIISTYFPLDNTYYNIFASYYDKDNYLLCHDDCVEERIIAFTFYLEDFDSGDLVLYDNDCLTEYKRISVRKNRLVLFEVGDKSFHEVSICSHGGRKAFSGWLCSPNYKTPKGHIQKRDLELPSKIIWIPKEKLEIPIPEKFDEVIAVDCEGIPFNEIETTTMGPFINRRYYSLKLEKYILPILSGFELIYHRCISFTKDSYILMKDQDVNEFRDVLDLFICEGCSEWDNFRIIYADSQGNIVDNLLLSSGQMFIRPRTGYYLVFPRQQQTVRFIHAIYKK